jgi:hypothetical protein
MRSCQEPTREGRAPSSRSTIDSYPLPALPPRRPDESRGHRSRGPSRSGRCSHARVRASRTWRIARSGQSIRRRLTPATRFLDEYLILHRDRRRTHACDSLARRHA